jgi:hypothetical protein
VKVEKMAKNGEKGQNSQPLSPGTALRAALKCVICCIVPVYVSEGTPIAMTTISYRCATEITCRIRIYTHLLLHQQNTFFS